MEYVQLRLKLEAFSIESLYPKTTVNSYDKQSNSKYVIEFDVAFLKAFMNFIVTGKIGTLWMLLKSQTLRHAIKHL